MLSTRVSLPVPGQGHTEQGTWLSRTAGPACLTERLGGSQGRRRPAPAHTDFPGTSVVPAPPRGRGGVLQGVLQRLSLLSPSRHCHGTPQLGGRAQRLGRAAAQGH